MELGFIPVQWSTVLYNRDAQDYALVAFTLGCVVGGAYLPVCACFILAGYVLLSFEA